MLIFFQLSEIIYINIFIYENKDNRIGPGTMFAVHKLFITKQDDHTEYVVRDRKIK